MGRRDRYEPGTFCWVDLATTDTEAAEFFYGELFGWRRGDFPAGESSAYSMMNLDGDVICGLFDMGDEMKSAGFPAVWQSYVSVDDASAVTRKAKEIGGEVLEEPFGVMGCGRSAVVRGPEGAVLPLWEPKEHIGASRVSDAGCFCLNQLTTTDPESATAFYEGLFGWEFSQQSEDPPYWGISNHGCLNGGMTASADGRSYWLVYFTTEDLDDSAARIEALGGTMTLPPTEIHPQSRILVASDPQGAALALFEGEVND